MQNLSNMPFLCLVCHSTVCGWNLCIHQTETSFIDRSIISLCSFNYLFNNVSQWARIHHTTKMHHFIFSCIPQKCLQGFNLSMRDNLADAIHFVFWWVTCLSHRMLYIHSYLQFCQVLLTFSLSSLPLNATLNLPFSLNCSCLCAVTQMAKADFSRFLMWEWWYSHTHITAGLNHL